MVEKKIKNEHHDIYLITNLVNSKKYVGLTKHGIHKRWKTHVADSRKEEQASRLLMKAIRKYGEDNFTIEVIDTANNVYEAGEKESYWIKELGTKGSKGYNLTEGGEGVRGYVLTEERRKQLSKQNSGDKNFWYGKTTNDSPHYGKELSQEHKEKLKLNNTNNKSVIINNIEYRSMSFAAQELNVTKACINSLINWKEAVKSVKHERILFENKLYYGKKNLAAMLNTSVYLLNKRQDIQIINTPWTFEEFLEYTRGLGKSPKPVEYEGKVFRSMKHMQSCTGLDKDVIKRLIRIGEVKEIEYKEYRPSHNARQVKFCGEVFPSKKKLMEYFNISSKEFNRLLDSGDIEEI